MGARQIWPIRTGTMDARGSRDDAGMGDMRKTRASGTTQAHPAGSYSLHLVLGNHQDPTGFWSLLCSDIKLKGSTSRYLTVQGMRGCVQSALRHGAVAGGLRELLRHA